jgi:hypothetical protein
VAYLSRMAEPFNLREWRRRSRQTSEEGRLFTYGRPGRGTSGYGKTRKRVDMPIIDQWVEGLPHAEILHIVSLLGRKKNDGYSEFAYYPFRSAMETGSNPTFKSSLIPVTTDDSWFTSFPPLTRKASRVMCSTPLRPASAH